MTFYEHAMLGATLAIAAGAQRRHGWGLIATAAMAAMLPDWDGLSLAFGPSAYANVHRVWGHNFLVAGLTGGAVGALGYLCEQSVRRRKAAQPPNGHSPKAREGALALAVWVAVGMLAGLTHPPVDAIFSGAAGASWPVLALWPFSQVGWSWPLVPWGDVGVTLIFVAEMFAIHRWSCFMRLIAVTSLVAVACYVCARGMLAGG